MLGSLCPSFLQVQDCWIARIVKFTGPGLLGIARVPIFYRIGIAHNGSGIARVPIFTGLGLLMMAPGFPKSQFLQVRDGWGLLRDRQVPIFAGPGSHTPFGFYKIKRLKTREM